MGAKMNAFAVQTPVLFRGDQCMIIAIDRMDDFLTIRRKPEGGGDILFHEFSYDDVLANIAPGDLIIQRSPKPVLDTSRLHEQDRRKVRRKQAYVAEAMKSSGPTAVANCKRVIRLVSKRIKDPKPPGVSTLGTWCKQFNMAGGDVTKTIVCRVTDGYQLRCSRTMVELVNDVFYFMAKEAGLARDPEVQTGVRESVLFLGETRPRTIKHGHKLLKLAAARLAVARKVDPENFGEVKAYKVPSYPTFCRAWSRTVPAVVRACIGKSDAEMRNIGRTKMHVYDLSRVLERVEIDFVHVNMQVTTDEGTRLGKVSVCAVIDCYSSAVMGWALHLGRVSENSEAVVNALVHAMVPKQDNAHLCHGRIEVLVVDHGSALLADHTTNFCADMIGTVNIAPVGAGYKKPFIESLFARLRSQSLSLIPAYYGKFRSVEQPEAPPGKEKITLTELQERLHHYFVNQLNNHPMDTKQGRTPNQMWEQSQQTYPICPIDDAHKLQNVMAAAGSCQLNRTSGVFIKYNWFNSPELTALYDRHSVSKKLESIKVTVQYNPLNCAAVDVGIGGDWICGVPNTRCLDRPMSFAERNAWKLRAPVVEDPGYVAPADRSPRPPMLAHEARPVDLTDPDKMLTDDEEDARFVAEATAEVEERERKLGYNRPTAASSTAKPGKAKKRGPGRSDRRRGNDAESSGFSIGKRRDK